MSQTDDSTVAVTGDFVSNLSAVPVHRTTLSTQIADRLINLIGRDGLKAGDDLPSEGRLATAFDVSRPVVREALRHLAALRMVELSNGRPARVMPVTPDLLGVYFQWAVRQDVANTLELHELRRGIEGMSAELAAERATGEERVNLRSLVTQMRSRLHSMDEYAELDAQLHELVVRDAHNSLLSHLVESIRGPLRTSIEAGLQQMKDDPDRLEQMQQGHEAIVDAVVSGDGATARRLMESHIGGASRRIAKTALQNEAPAESLPHH